MNEAQDLSAPLMPTRPKRSIAGLLMVTSAALLFGIVAAFVKATSLPTLVMLQIRSILEWALGAGVAWLYYDDTRAGRSVVVPAMPQPETALRAETFDEGKLESDVTDEKEGLWMLLVGPARLRGWLILRAFLYWGFLACWWFALTQMPIGDATTIVYTGRA